jgi:uncharacterized protein (TIGR03435 family)
VGIHSAGMSSRRRIPFLMVLRTPALVVALCLATLPLGAQSGASQAAASQLPSLNRQEWEKAAGGQRQFDVASVKLNKSGPPPSGNNQYSNFPLGPGDGYVANGGLFSSINVPLAVYVTFAYKINSSQAQAFFAQLPKWVITDRYDIQARSEGTPTKDQMRLMMQSLLADRFKLAIHVETRQLPVLALKMVKTGTLGPNIQQHPANIPCGAQPTPGTAPGVPLQREADGFPYCGGVGGMNPTVPGRVRIGAKDVTVQLIANQMSGSDAAVDRPVLDRTGLSGAFDFTLEWTPQFDGPLPAGSTFQPDPTGPTFMEALKEQLGFKLEPQTGPVDVFVVDHVEQPSAN